MENVSKKIKGFWNGKIELTATAISRENAWVELTNLGVRIEGCFKTAFDNKMSCYGYLEAA